MKKLNKLILIIFAIFLLSFNFVAAEEPDRILSNSEDWRDVYSVMQYGHLVGKTTNFLVSDRHATLILNSITKDTHIWAISSTQVPFVIGYKTLMEGRGYTAEEFEFDNINLELARLLEGVNNFIVIDDSYGYNAISVAPYAAVTKSYVLFTDRENINEIDEFLSETGVNKLLIYGQMDRVVRNTLAKYNPEIINKEGDRFLNNIEIVKKYQELRHAKQAILTNGEFIEQEVMSGSEPVIFIGTNNVPEVVREYIQSSDIEVGVLIGNELVGTATFIRRQVGISVFVKFAQGARAPRGSISQVEALDMFYLPVYTLNLEIEGIKYNKATEQLEVTLKNTEDQAVYFVGTYALTDVNGDRQTVGDVGANFIDGNELKTMVYDVGAMPEGGISVDVFVIYGESKGSLEKEIRKTMEVDTVTVLDQCKIDLKGVSVNLRNKFFYIETENLGSIDCYVDVELVDLVIAGQRVTYGLQSVEHFKGKQKKKLRIKVDDFEKEDVEDNENVLVRAYWGERENSLVNSKDWSFELRIKGIDYLFYGLMVVIVILLILILWKRRKKKEEEKKPKDNANPSATVTGSTPQQENKLAEQPKPQEPQTIQENKPAPAPQENTNQNTENKPLT